MAEVVLKIVRKLKVDSPMLIFIRGSEMMICLKFDKSIRTNIQILVSQKSTGLPLGNQVDGLPSARHCILILVRLEIVCPTADRRETG